MFKIEIDVKDFLASMSDIEKRQLPFAAMNALNDTMFAVRKEWQDQMPRVFDRPTPFITNSVLYKKATKQNLVAEVWIKGSEKAPADSPFIGSASLTRTPPEKVLQAEVYGGSRRMKASEKALGRFWVAGQGIRPQLDPYGNVPVGVIRKILSQLGRAEPVAGFQANQTEISKGRRLRRSKRKGTRGGEYFLVRTRRGKLRAGIYERIRTGFGTAVRSVLFFVNDAPRYKVRFDAQKFARDVFHARFPANFVSRMTEAIATAR